MEKSAGFSMVKMTSKVIISNGDKTTSILPSSIIIGQDNLSITFAHPNFKWILMGQGNLNITFAHYFCAGPYIIGIYEHSQRVIMDNSHGL